MRIFWAIIAVLVIVAVIVLTSMGGTSPRTVTPIVVADDNPEAPAQPDPTEPDQAVPESPAPIVGGDDTQATDDQPVDPVNTVDIEVPEDTEPVVSNEPTDADTSPVDVVSAPNDEEEPPAVVDQADVDQTPAPAEDAEIPETVTTDAPDEVESTGTDVAGPEAPPTAEPWVERDDGTVVIDGSYVITGKGTAEAPYVVDWGLFVSASRTYQPRLGQTELPGWVEHLEGRHVRLTGFMLLPIVSTQASELLLMQNQWDGCCIGVPPTPFDAVEVKLRAPMDISGGVLSYGEVSGVLDVDPYLVSNWLLGLYVINEATVGNARDIPVEHLP